MSLLISHDQLELFNLEFQAIPAITESIARSATVAAIFSSRSGSGDQSIFVADAKCDIGCASMPMLEKPIFLHSTIVVPVPQNGSKIHALESSSNFSTYWRTR